MYKGIAVKIDGSAYNPFNLVPSLSMKTSPAEASRVDAAICPKGHAGIQTMYDPYRITKVIKRVGKRGEGKWMTVPFDQAISEIVNGGKLFAHVPGEENREVEGLKSTYALRDSKIAKAMADDAKEIAKAKDKKKAVEEFKVKHAENLKYLIDPDHPDFGPKNNQLVYEWGRLKGGRSEFGLRFFGDYFGTVNTHGHTTVCQGSLYFTCKAMSEQYEYNKFGGGKKFYWQGDLENTEFVLFVGANLFDANYGPPNRARRISQNLFDGKTKIAVADPRYSKLASKANRYLPVNPGEDGALFQGIIQWILGNKKFDAKYLSNANKAAAKAAGEPTWSNAVLLVKLDKDGKPGKFLRAHEIGLAPAEKRKDKDGKEHEFEYLVAMKDGKPIAVDPNDEKNAVTGDLLVNTEVNGIKVKSSLQIIADAANSRSMEEWSKICGIPIKDIEDTAKDLTSHGKKAVVDVHRGIAQHTNGFYNVTGAMTVNLLLGNFDWKGGMIAASSYNTTGGKEGQPFDLGKMSPGKASRFGISVIRHDVKYEDSTLFNGYPAKRNWWPLSSDIYEEIIPSIGDAYPYPVKSLFTLHGRTDLLSAGGANQYRNPRGREQGAALFHHRHPDRPDHDVRRLHLPGLLLPGAVGDAGFPPEHAGEGPADPAAGPRADPGDRESLRRGDAVLLRDRDPGPGRETGDQGVRQRRIRTGQDFTKQDDFYIRMVANVATDGSPVPDADDAELKLFLESRKHLPRSVFDPQRWEKIAGPNWRKVVHVLNRGGRFQEYKDIYKGDLVANQYKSLINIYQEKTAGTKNAFTGKSNPGYATYVPISTALGKSPKDEGLTEGYPLHLITQRDVTQTKSRTITNYWLLSILPENLVILNPLDGKKMGIQDGDSVKFVSATNKEGVWDLGNGKKMEMRGKVKLTETIKPGVVTFTIGHGQWASGATDVVIDGKVIKGDPKRATGFNANAAMWIDPHLKNTCMIDPVGGSVSFYDTKVNLVKA